MALNAPVPCFDLTIHTLQWAINAGDQAGILRCYGTAEDYNKYGEVVRQRMRQSANFQYKALVGNDLEDLPTDLCASRRLWGHAGISKLPRNIPMVYRLTVHQPHNNRSVSVACSEISDGKSR